MKPITLTLLKSLNACQKQVDLFAANYGESVIPTLALCEAAAHTFDFEYACDTLINCCHEALTEANWVAYHNSIEHLRRELRQAKAHHRKVYEDAKAPLRKACNELIRCEQVGYREAAKSQGTLGQHWDAYAAAKVRHRTDYDKACLPLREALRLAVEPLESAFALATAPYEAERELAQARIFFQFWSNQ